ncbi:MULTISPECIES: hypothetical protein [Streptomyces]|uniref:Uncharacterized protein n=1 Tax=Streptomyces dengpaensis TaxID=2049881 RepID=A0ABN5I5R7_9ACTN|nr:MULTISPECIES: hypothetical protein [Streptomyces]AVH58412.1 hypothetical protein C4B68_24530 [Streptomyces dengpaensis]PIB06085.1 hypothetical protein B1C81_26250 [Streptomyces sp. HG99]
MSEQTPEPTFRDSVTRLAALGALFDEVKAAYRKARTEVQHHLNTQYKEAGTTKVDALLPGGTKVGSVSRTGGETAAQIVDPDTFTAWVRDTFPSEHVVEIVPMQVRTSVRPAWSDQALAAMTAAGTPRYVDEATGEVHDVPGVEIRPSAAAGLRMTYTRKSKNSPYDGRELVAEAWRTDDLAAHVLPVLAPAAQPAAIQTCGACGAGYDYGQPCPTCEFKDRMATETAPTAAKPAPQVSRRFPAAFDGECKHCDGPIDEGDEIAYVDDEIACETCAEATA